MQQLPIDHDSGTDAPSHADDHQVLNTIHVAENVNSPSAAAWQSLAT